MVKKSITGALAGVLSLGIVTPVLATEGTVDLDALNKAAYEAVVAAQEEGTQSSINTARRAVQALKEAKPDSEHILGIVRNYSSALDKVQHPILSTAITATLKAQESGKQADINAAFDVLPKELLELDGTSEGNKDIWRNKYRDLSSILDKAQLALQTKTSEAVKKAQEEKTAEAVAAAQALVSEVATSNKAEIKEWAAIMQERVDAIVVQELVITEVVRISKDSVDIKFEAVKEELQNITVEVKDAEGTVYAVNALDYISKGDTSATFTFKEALKEEPTGKWTVEGVEYNADKQATVDAVKAATTQQKLADALEAYGDFINYDVNNVGYYFDLLNINREKIQTIGDIQTLIVDTGNKDAEKAEDVAYVKASPNNVVLGQRLIEVGFDVVNKDWLDDYNTIDGKEITGPLSKLTKFSSIQAHIDGINVTKITGEIDKAVQSIKVTEVNEVTKLVNDFYPGSEEYKEDKQTALDKLAVQKAICGVLDATSPEGVVSAIEGLAKVDKTFKLTHLNKDLGKAYIDAFNDQAAVATEVNTSALISKALDEINTHETGKAVTELFKFVDTIETTTADDKANFIKDKQANEDFAAHIDRLAKASANEEKSVEGEKVKFDLTKVKPASNYEYVRQLKLENHSVTGANEGIATVNGDAISNIFNNIVTNPDLVLEEELMGALATITSDFGLKNVDIANKAVYVDNADYIADFTQGEKETELETLQVKIDKLNILATVADADSAVADVIAAVKEYRNILEKEGNNLISGTVTTGQISDVAELINKDVLDAKYDVVVLDDLNTAITTNIAAQKTIVDGVEKALAEAGKVKEFELTGTAIKTEDVTTPISHDNIANTTTVKPIMDAGYTVTMNGTEVTDETTVIVAGTIEAIKENNSVNMTVEAGTDADTFKYTGAHVETIITEGVTVDSVTVEANKDGATVYHLGGLTVDGVSMSGFGIGGDDSVFESKLTLTAGEEIIFANKDAVSYRITLNVAEKITNTTTDVNYGAIKKSLEKVIDGVTIEVAEKVYAGYLNDIYLENGQPNPTFKGYQDFTQIRNLAK